MSRGENTAGMGWHRGAKNMVRTSSTILRDEFKRDISELEEKYDMAEVATEEDIERMWEEIENENH